MGQGAFAAVLHCFTGGADLARTAVDLGLTLSFSGVLTFKASDALRAIASGVPDNQLLVETDAPFLAPVPRRGMRNEPAFVVHTAEVLARCRSTTLPALAALTTANACRLFRKMPPFPASANGRAAEKAIDHAGGAAWA